MKTITLKKVNDTFLAVMLTFTIITLLFLLKAQEEGRTPINKGLRQSERIVIVK